MGKRRKARELALQSLYELESPEKEPESVLSGQALRRKSSDESVEYARRLIGWTRTSSASLDGAIAARLEHWDIERLSLICRLILRMGLAEGIHAPEVPVKVILDEAIELARKFDSEEGAGFVNGILEGLLFAVREEPA